MRPSAHSWSLCAARQRNPSVLCVTGVDNILMRQISLWRSAAKHFRPSFRACWASQIGFCLMIRCLTALPSHLGQSDFGFFFNPEVRYYPAGLVANSWMLIYLAFTLKLAPWRVFRPSVCVHLWGRVCKLGKGSGLRWANYLYLFTLIS